jgi:hypothetical protein
MDTVLIRHTSELASLAVVWEHPIRLLPIFIHSVTVNRAPLRHVGAWARAGRFPGEAVILLQGNHTV